LKQAEENLVAIGEVAGSTTSSVFSSTQLSNTQRAAQQELQASAKTNGDGDGDSDDKGSVATASSAGSTGSTGNSTRGTQVDLFV